jgi:hypothetical protein
MSEKLYLGDRLPEIRERWEGVPDMAVVSTGLRVDDGYPRMGTQESTTWEMYPSGEESELNYPVALFLRDPVNDSWRWAHAPDDIRWLIAELKRSRQANAELSNKLMEAGLIGFIVRDE